MAERVAKAPERDLALSKTLSARLGQDKSYNPTKIRKASVAEQGLTLRTP